ncbi:MAG: hypothetical protein IPM88_20820 [Nitrospira sp.]|nr:hypothetical protein [Nitrospira sp.]
MLLLALWRDGLSGESLRHHLCGTNPDSPAGGFVVACPALRGGAGPVFVAAYSGGRRVSWTLLTVLFGLGALLVSKKELIATLREQNQV